MPDAAIQQEFIHHYHLHGEHLMSIVPHHHHHQSLAPPVTSEEHQLLNDADGGLGRTSHSSFVFAVLETIGKSIFCGAFAGACNSTVSFPLDTIKVRAQSQQGKLSYAAVVADGWRAGGIRNFYRGVSLPMLGVMCDNSAIFATNTAVLSLLERWCPSSTPIAAQQSADAAALHGESSAHHRPVLHTVIAGAMSGVSSGLVLTPFELVKCRIQLWKSMPLNTYSSSAALASGTLPTSAPSIRRVAKVIYSHEGGLLGFFQGYRATIVREVPGTLTWLLTYQNIIAYYQRHYSDVKRKVEGVSEEGRRPLAVAQQPPPLVSMFAGGMAGVAYWTIGYPADFIKTRVQSGALRSSSHTDVGVMSAILDILKTGGIRGLYRGYGITVARAFPSNAILFTAYEYASGTWDRNLAIKFRN
jgi:mitochondrial ornithine carrier protein